MQGDKVFLDTNIVTYAYDISAGEKHKLAKEHMIDCWNSRVGLISTQVLQEFFVTVTKKLSKPLEVKLAKKSEDLSDCQTIGSVTIKNPFVGAT